MSPVLDYILISVRLWNFKDGGSLKASFLAKNQHATKEKSLKNHTIMTVCEKMTLTLMIFDKLTLIDRFFFFL